MLTRLTAPVLTPDGAFGTGRVVRMEPAIARALAARGQAELLSAGTMGDGPRVLYLMRPNIDVGSAYKFSTMFRRVIEGVVVWGRPDDHETAIDYYRPDAIACQGDAHKTYEVALRHGLPYLLIEQDVYSLRDGREQPFERDMLEGAAAVLFTSEDHQAYCAERYDLPYSEVVHLRPLAEQLDFEPMPKLPGKRLVYAGGLVGPKDRTGFFGYRAYHRIFSAFIERGWDVDVYPGYGIDDHKCQSYLDIGCTVHEKVPHRELARHLSQYTAGFQGYADMECRRSAIDYCMTCRPNKLWDYLMAGIPTIGFRTGNGGAIYDGRWGLVIDSLDDIPEPDALPVVTESMRREQVMDGDLPAFERLVEAWLSSGPMG